MNDTRSSGASVDSTVDPATARRALVRFVATEHANERGAALAYRGHASSLRDPSERAEVSRIEAEEWQHRAELAALLTQLGGHTSWWREPLMATIGWCIGVSCHVGGWLMPMLGAGIIEWSNIRGYAHGVAAARSAGLPEVAAQLAHLGRVEEAHAAFFFTAVRRHWLGRWWPTRWQPGAAHPELVDDR